jgi:Holliday junction resolvase
VNRDIGKNAERELVSILKSEGFYAVRIPTSNSSSNPLPDVFATKGNLLLAIECKSTWEDKVKVREIQIKKLFEFLSMFPMDGKAIIAVKFKSIHRWKTFEIHKIEEIVVTKENSDYLESFLSINRRYREQSIV